jgi:hypothetical protein
MLIFNSELNLQFEKLFCYFHLFFFVLLVEVIGSESCFDGLILQ